MGSDERIVVERAMQGGQGRRWERGEQEEEGGRLGGEEVYIKVNNQGRYYSNNNLHAKNISTCVSFIANRSLLLAIWK